MRYSWRTLSTPCIFSCSSWRCGQHLDPTETAPPSFWEDYRKIGHNNNNNNNFCWYSWCLLMKTVFLFCFVFLNLVLDQFKCSFNCCHVVAVALKTLITIIDNNMWEECKHVFRSIQGSLLCSVFVLDQVFSFHLKIYFWINCGNTDGVTSLANSIQPRRVLSRG